MSRLSIFNSPFLLGFEDMEHLVESVAKSSGEGYPPYNIEQHGKGTVRISLAVAGFSRTDLAVTLENRQLIVRGRQEDTREDTQTFLHRGIAKRQLMRRFLLADGMEVTDAFLENGLLHIDVARPKSDPAVQTIPIRE